MDESTPKRGRGRARGARGRARARGRGRGRGKKAPSPKAVESDSEAEVETKTVEEKSEVVCPKENEEVCAPIIDPDGDISQLEAPTFTTINRGPPEPMLRLDWSNKVNLIGEKVLNPMIHCCDKCLKPILIYGRMIPCKHVFCLACGRREQKQCSRCFEKFSRVEQTGLGTVFMCTHGGSRYGSTGCRRTYLSQRDLQAHINHRHVSAVPQAHAVEVVEPERSVTVVRPKMAGDPRTPMPMSTTIRQRLPTVRAQTNLITVPIQDTTPAVVLDTPPPNYYNQYPQTPTYQPTSMPPLHIPPPQQPQYYTAPTGYSAPQGYQTYNNSAPAANQYQNPLQNQPCTTPQYDFTSPPPSQWPGNQQYYR